MRAGLRNRRIELLRKPAPGQETLDSLGEPVDVPVKFGEAWAEVTVAGGTEQVVNQQLVARVTMRFRIAWRPDLTPLDFVRCDGRLYDVVSVEEVETRATIEVRGWARAEGAIVQGTG